MAVTRPYSHAKLDARFNDVAAPSATHALILLRTIPDANGENWAELTVGVNGYARVNLNDSNMAAANTSGTGYTAEPYAVKNSAILGFTASGGAFSHDVVGVGIIEISSSLLGEFTTFSARTVSASETVRYDVGACVVRLL